jgi:hypothetical protein
MYTGANDGTTALNTATSGLSNAPIYLKSAIGNGASGSYRGTWEDVLSSGKINIDTQYQSSGRILVTWNVRIIGYSPNSAYTVWPTLCSAFHGTVNQRFTGGNAYTRLVVSKDNANWVALGNQISMTIPDAPGIKSVTNSSDPTHTGSYLITPTTFGTTTLPSKIYLKVQWKNDTALILGSADKMRSLVVTITRD